MPWRSRISSSATTRRARSRSARPAGSCCSLPGRPDHVVIECGGVGYRLAVSAETLKAVPARGKEILLNTHLVMRDDGIHLYGFATEEELELFLLLIGVQGVGPKVALAVLSGGTTRELLRAVGAGGSAPLP